MVLCIIYLYLPVKLWKPSLPIQIFVEQGVRSSSMCFCTSGPCVCPSLTQQKESPHSTERFFLPSFLPSSSIQLNPFACDNFLRMFSHQINSHEEVIKIVKRRDDLHPRHWMFSSCNQRKPVKSWFIGPRMNKWWDLRREQLKKQIPRLIFFMSKILNQRL